MKRHEDTLIRRSPAHRVHGQFRHILERVSVDHRRLTPTQNDPPSAVTLGGAAFLAAVANPSRTIKALQEQAKAYGASGITLEAIEAEIAAGRQQKAAPQPS